jgi:hypothetical protein
MPVELIVHAGPVPGGMDVVCSQTLIARRQPRREAGERVGPRRRLPVLVRRVRQGGTADENLAAILALHETRIISGQWALRLSTRHCARLPR